MTEEQYDKIIDILKDIRSLILGLWFVALLTELLVVVT